MLRQADFVDRNCFADYLNRRGLLGCAVEVGVHRGEWSALFLSNWHGRRFVGVDPWSVPPGYEPQAALLPHPGDREADYKEAKRILLQDERVTLVRGTSEQEASAFADSSLDFVYIDGDHRRAEITKDLRLWWPKVRSGGLLAGHDVLSSEPYSAYEEVQPAVLEFAAAQGVDVYFVIELVFQPWSFYMVKP